MLTRLESAPAAAQWLRARLSPTGRLRSDSRAVQAGDAFIAWPGQNFDARCAVPAALAAGAAACLVEEAGVEVFAFDDTRVAALPALQAAGGVVADIVYGAPSAQLKVLASTGTNGKTSITWWLAQALGTLGQRCAVVGTLGVGEPPAATHNAAQGLRATGLTTPDAISLQTALRDCVDQGLVACALEASSIGLLQQRLAGTRIQVALFSNLTRDHLDVHGDMAAYAAAKRCLFDWPSLRAAVINVDDEHGARWAEELCSGGLDLWTVSTQGAARLQAHNLHHAAAGMVFDVHERAHETAPGIAQQAAVHSTLVGEFNANNLLLVIGGLRALGLSLAEAAAAVARVTPVPGRLQPVRLDGTTSDIDVLVDYAHTPDALDKTLLALRPLATARGGRLWCVFGCGGDRDASKRPLMGAIAAGAADQVVLTSDNPRSEAPERILAQILGGLPGRDAVDVIADRRAAIQSAVQRARAGDVILLAGKGHETTQEIGGVKTLFSDVDEARAALLHRRATQP